MKEPRRKRKRSAVRPLVRHSKMTKREKSDELIRDAKAALARVELKAARLREAITTFTADKNAATHN